MQATTTQFDLARQPFLWHKKPMFEEWIGQIRSGNELSPDAIIQIVAALLNEEVAAELKADFLIALAIREETPAELASFVRALRDRSIPLPLPDSFANRQLLDVCGTGGDRLGTFNISTTVAFVCAAAGAVVVKHGNRAVTSKSGSADVLEQLGISIDLSPVEVAASLEKHGFAFLFAPRFHPAFRALASARRLCAERGQRTLFNFIGPLMNPARPTAQLVGVARPEWVVPMAHVLQALGLHRAMVVSGEIEGEGTLDELSTLGINTVAEFYQKRGFHSSSWSPANFPLQPATLKDLAGGDAAVNAAIILSILRGQDRGPRRDAVLLNAAAGLYVAGLADSLVEGWDMARETLESGKADAKLKQLQDRG